YGTMNLDGEGTGGATLPFHNLTIKTTSVVTLTGNLNVRNGLLIETGATTTKLIAGTRTITLAGDYSNSGGKFVYNTSTLAFEGDGVRELIKTAAVDTFYNVSMNKASGFIRLKSAISIKGALTFTKGHFRLKGSTTYVSFTNTGSITGSGKGKYIGGPVRKLGNQAFTFPIGDTLLVDSVAFHPLGMSAPGVATDEFEGRYFGVGQVLGDSLVDSLARISNNEYWTLNRLFGSSNVTTTLYWNKNSAAVDDYDGMRVASWNGVKWLDRGNGGLSITGPFTGFITASLALTLVTNTPMPVVIANRNQTIPYATLKRKLDGGFYYVTNSNLRFKYDEEYADTDQQLQFVIYNDFNQNVASTAQLSANLLASVVTSYGDNRYAINITSCQLTPNGYLPSGYYVLEISNEKNERLYLRFKNTNTLIYQNCSSNNGSN
ncbi:MAG: hypothetical protein ACRCYO_15870, partial [Bacteroidia bacterium]